MIFITAEIGTNHLGDIKVVKQLINVAKAAGWDAIKFQKKSVNKIYSEEFLNSPLESPWGTTQRDMRVHREFSIKQIQEIDKYCKKKNISWYASCWDIDSQLQMQRFKTKYNKVASAMLVHHKLLEIIAKEKKYTFIATGMSTLKDIEKAVKIFKKFLSSKKKSGQKPALFVYLISIRLEILAVSDVSRSSSCVIKSEIKRLPTVPVRVLFRLLISNIKSTDCD